MRGVTWDGCSYAHVNFNRDSFSVSSRSTTEPTMLRAGPENQPVVRLVAVNRSEVEHAPHPLLGILFHFIISRLIRFLSSSSIVIIYFVLPIRICSESLSLGLCGTSLATNYPFFTTMWIVCLQRYTKRSNQGKVSIWKAQRHQLLFWKLKGEFS